MRINSFLVLAASSIAFLASCGCSNNRDQQFLNQINETLAKHTEIITCNDAVNVLKTNDIDIFNYQFSNAFSEFVYDFDTKQFVVMQNDSIVCAPSGYVKNQNNFSYFKFTNVYNGNADYSQYLLDDFPETENLIVTTGIDVGNHKDIKNVTYAGSVGIERNIKIRVYCDYLTIYADSDTVSYYGNANNIFVNDVETFDVYGTNCYAQLRSGKTTFKANSSTDFLEIPNGYEKEVEVSKESDAVVYCSINAESVQALQQLEVNEVDTLTSLNEILAGDEDKFIRLTWDITSTEDIVIPSGRTFIIDLNGFSISLDPNNVGDTYLSIMGSLYLIDTESAYNDNCGIYLLNYYTYETEIKVYGYMLMNGGNVFATCNEDTAFEAIDVSGQFDMYGGKIVVESVEDTVGISQGPNSIVNIFYGTIICSNEAFENGKGVLNIAAGKFITLSENRYLLTSESGEINILGGTFTAKNCMYLSNFDGDVNVSILGGRFYSDGYYSSEDKLGSTISVIMESDANKYVINISNAYLYSHYGYIVDVYGSGSGSATINCHSGIYDYYLGNGIHVEEGLESFVTINKGGNWINHYA